MSEIKKGLLYSKDHEWVLLQGSKAYIGITDYAQHSLGDIVFAEGEPVGTEVSAGDTIGVIESVKAASDVYTPISGTIAETNDVIADAPESINAAPYDSWIVVLEVASPDLSELMDADAYSALCDKL